MLLLSLEQRLAQPSITELTGIKNTSLGAARRAKNDEFYTQLTDIEKELQHYKSHFKGKVVFCNCDDPDWSSFWKYFTRNFVHLGLKMVVATHYAPGQSSWKREYTGGEDWKGVETRLSSDGDFRSQECVEILRQADIVVTNPPFSLFREYVAQLVSHDKKFLIIGNNNALSYKEVFPLIKGDEMWLGVSPRSMTFKQPDGSVKDVNACWFTNLTHPKRNEELLLFKTYFGNEPSYPHYDNYDAIEVSKVGDIPVDYQGAMGVPITFLDKYNPSQFQILGITDRDNNSGLKTREYDKNDAPNPGDLNRRGVLKTGDSYKSTYARLLIKRKTS